MLEIIVLGQVPGTSIQITFFQISVFVLSLVLLAMLARELRSHLKFSKELLPAKSMAISLNRLAIMIRRKV